MAMNSTFPPTPDSNAVDLQYEFESRAVWVVVMESTLYITIVTSAFLGNSIVLWILLRNPHLRSIPNYFVMSLAVSDVLQPMFGSSASVVMLTSGRQVISDAYCQFQGFICTWLACASLATLTLMAVNRYYRIVKPVKYRTVFTSRRTKVFICLIWVLALLSPSYPIIVGQKYYFHPGKFFCYLKLSPSSTPPFMGIFLGVPLILVTYCYLRVFRTLRRHNVRMRSTSVSSEADASPKLTVAEIRVTKTLFATVAAFWVCWIPIAVVDSTEIGLGQWSLPRRVYYMYSIFAISSSAVNPIIYGVINKTFTDEYRKLFGWKNRRDSTPRVQPGGSEMNDRHQPALISFTAIKRSDTTESYQESCETQ